MFLVSIETKHADIRLRRYQRTARQHPRTGKVDQPVKFTPLLTHDGEYSTGVLPNHVEAYRRCGAPQDNVLAKPLDRPMAQGY